MYLVLDQKENRKSRLTGQLPEKGCGSRFEPLVSAPAVMRKGACACGGGCPACQAKSALNVSQPNDPAEIEADQIADRVMRMPVDDAKPKSNFSYASDAVDRKCNACDNEEEEVTETPVMRKEAFAAAPTPPRDDTPSSIRNVINSGGQQLDMETRDFFEPRFGADLSNVRIFTDHAAGQSARSIAARAYTLGSNIVFGNGEYKPESDSGKHLLAHELAHVGQLGPASTKVYRDRDPAFTIEGLPGSRSESANFVFFDLSEPDDLVTPENDIDPVEKAKIEDFAATHAGGVSLFGFASEEGGEADNRDLINRRLRAVTNVLTAPPISYDPALIVTREMLTASQSRFDYRSWRAVEMQEGTAASSSRALSAAAAANRGEEACSTDLIRDEITPARDAAVDDINDAITAINEFQSDRAANDETGDALRFFFRSDSDATVRRIIIQLNANIAFLNRMMSLLSCGTSQSVDCGETAGALTSPQSITLCQGFFDARISDEARSDMLVHESAHGSRELNDRAYSHEAIFTFLTTREALDNADSYSLFVRSIRTGVIPDVGRENTALNCGTDEDLAKEIVAWAERWNTYAVMGLQQTYGNESDYWPQQVLPTIRHYFGRSDRSALAGILDRYLQMMNFFEGGDIGIECVDRTDPLYNTWKIARWSATDRSVKICNEQLRASHLNQDDRTKYVYGALAVDRFGVPEEHRMAYPNVARAYKLFYWEVW